MLTSTLVLYWTLTVFMTSRPWTLLHPGGLFYTLGRGLFYTPGDSSTPWGGVSSTPRGTLLHPQMDSSTPQGTLLHPQGLFYTPGGLFYTPGALLHPRGTLLHPRGTLLHPRGTLLYPGAGGELNRKTKVSFDHSIGNTSNRVQRI